MPLFSSLEALVVRSPIIITRERQMQQAFKVFICDLPPRHLQAVFFRLPRQISKGGHHLASLHFLQRRVDFKSCQLGYWLVHPSQLFDDGEQILPPQSVSPLQYSWRRHLIINRFLIFTCQLIKRFYRFYPALYRFK